MQTLFLALITALPAIWLCFYSRRKLSISRITAAFLLGWLIVGALDRAIIVMLAAGIVTAVAAALLTAFNAEFASRLLPFLCGGLVGVKMIQLAGYIGAGHIVVILLMTMLMAAAMMLLALRFGERVEILAAAAGGAGALLTGAGMIPLLNWLAYPLEAAATTLALAAWLTLTIVGAVCQFRDLRRRSV